MNVIIIGEKERICRKIEKKESEIESEREREKERSPQ